MPLSAYVQSRIEAIRAFLADADAVVLELRCAPEQRAVVGKLLVGLSEEGEWLWAAVDEPFVDAAHYCGAIATALAAAVDDAAKEFAAAEVAFSPPPPFDAAAARPGRTLEQRLIEHAEQTSLALVPFLHGTVVVCAVDDASAASLPLAATVGRLTEACEGGRVKLVLLTTAAQPLVRDVEVPRPRIVALRAGEGTATARTLRQVAIDALPRLLVYDAPRRGQTWMPTALVEAGVANGALIVRVDDVRFWRPIHFYARATELVAQACHDYCVRAGQSERSAAMLAEVAAPIGRHGAEIVFAQQTARMQRELLPPELTLAVVLCPSLAVDVPPGELEAFHASLGELARAAFSSRVKFFAVAPGVESVARPRLGRVMRAETFRIDAPVIEAGLVDKLAAPELPPLERLRCLSALAALRMEGGDPESGIDLSVEALELAQRTEDPVEIATAWYGMGGALYHCAALDKANDAYAQCVDLAVTHDHAVLAAQGITGMGHCEFVIGQCDRAIERYQVAVKYWTNLRNPLAEAYVRTWIGEAHAKAGRGGEAIAELDRALGRCDAVHETMHDAAETSRADIMQRKARIYERMGLQGERRRELELARKHGATAPPSIDP